MIDRYDPEVAPDPVEWLALGDGERHDLVADFHREARIPLPKAARPIHAALHVSVENQLAMEDQEIVRATLQRLMGEGLTRHEAVHAIGTVLIGYMRDILQENDEGGQPDRQHTAYYEVLKELTAKNWRHG